MMGQNPDMEAKEVAEATLDNPEQHIKEDWSLPDPPVCEGCGEEGTPEAYHTGRCWALSWGCSCQDLCDVGLTAGPHRIDWPFKTDYAHRKHLEAAGFEIV